jgi:RHS repeat-associated protein
LGTSSTPAPVFFDLNSAIEQVTDLQLPGPKVGWSHTRTYDSRLSRYTQSGSFIGMEGTRWQGSATGSYLRYEGDDARLYVDASNTITFVEDGGNFISPSDSPVVMVNSGSGASEIFTLTNTETGDVTIFYGLDSAVAAASRGRIKERTTRAYQAIPQAGTTYTYTSNGSVDTVMTPQGTLIQYEYFGGTDRYLKRISVYAGADDTTTLLQRVEYMYTQEAYDSEADFENETNRITPHGDVGEDGDLIQVKVFKRATDDTGDNLSIVRTTQYRYVEYRSHTQIKLVLEADAIQRAIDFSDSDSISAPEDLLVMADDADIGSGTTKDLDAFASRSFTHYDVAYVPSPSHWGSSEVLDTKYGGYSLTYQDDILWGGAVESETIGGGCASCSSGVDIGVRKEYFYLELADWYDEEGEGEGHDEPNLVVRIVVEDTFDSSDTPRYRRLYGVNFRGSIIREVLMTDPLNPSYYNIWCWSTILGDSHSGGAEDDWRVIARRMPSAHWSEVTSNADVKMFLNPYDPTETTHALRWANDFATSNDATGLVYHYEYDSSGKRQSGMLVSEGIDDQDSTYGTEEQFYVSATDWTNEGGSGGDANYQMSATYEYPTKTTTRGTVMSPGVADVTTYAYTFWDMDGTALKSVTKTLPEITTGENGSGTATTTSQYFDTLGRLRWTKDGEGYVDYYSYDPDTGGQAYMAVDVPNSYSPTVDNSKWVAVGDGDADTIQPSRGTGLPTTLDLVTTYEYDTQGRRTLMTDPGDGEHATKYFADGTIDFSYVDSGNPTLPAKVRKINNGDQLVEIYSVDPSTVSTSITSLPSTVSNYTSRTAYHYHPVNGQLAQVDRYHNADGSGEGTDSGDAFYGTRYLYDPLGRRGATIQYVEDGKFQVTAQLFDVLDRPVESRRAVATAVPDDYGELIDGTFDSWLGMDTELETVSKNVYDSSGVGDSYVTSSKSFYGTGANDYVDMVYHRTYRGHIRGIERRNGPSTDIEPYMVNDVDWMGRTTATAQYDTEPTWPTNYSDHVFDFTGNAPDESGHFELNVTRYDDLGRVFRTQRYPGESTNYLDTNNYYDRNNRLAITGDFDVIHTEYAYDGAGRKYEARIVRAPEPTKYIGAAIRYRSPVPNPSIASVTGTDDQVIELTHDELDASGNVTETHTFEQCHRDHPTYDIITGIDLTNDDDYVRRSVYSWYDAADRVIAMADYGSGDTTAGAGTWKYSAIPTRPGTAPTYAHTDVTNGRALLTTYTYDDAGRLEVVSDPEEIETKTFYDDLSRRTSVAENYVNFSHPTTGIGGGTNNQEDRVTSWTYNGLGNIESLTAYNGSSSDDQVTEYDYDDGYNASLNTRIIYPDSTGGSDDVEMTYNIDGSLATRTDQRGVVMTYTYDTARRLSREGATTIASADGSIKSIARTYDDFGRVETITSYANADGTGTVRNQIEYVYGTTGRVTKTYQSHEGAVVTGGGSVTPSVAYTFDSATSSNRFSNANRLSVVTYPSGRVSNIGWSNSDGMDDALVRIRDLWFELPGVGATYVARYRHNGVGRLARSIYSRPQVQLQYYGSDQLDENYEHLDRFGRVKNQVWEDYSETVFDVDHIAYGYDAAGNRTWRNNLGVTGANNIYDQFLTYDGLHRLKHLVQGLDYDDDGDIDSLLQFTQQWTLDQLGNWGGFKQDNDGSGWDLEQTRAHNDVNEVGTIGATTGTNWVDPVHDAAGNMTTMPGVHSLGSYYDLKYDAWNRLVQTYDGEVVDEIEYDGLHRRIVRNEYGTDYDYFYNEDWQLLETRKNDDTDPLEQFVWHPYYIDALAMRLYDADTDGIYGENNDGEQYYLQDANYNVTAVIDETGTVLERYHYTPYGEVTTLNPDFTVFSTSGYSAIGNNHLFTGRERDGVTGLQLNRWRYYHAPLGRWLTRDPIEYEGGPNLYQYANGNSILHVDPEGLLSGIAKCYADYNACARAADDAFDACSKGPLPASVCEGEFNARMEKCGDALTRCLNDPPEPWRPPPPPPHSVDPPRTDLDKICNPTYFELFEPWFRLIIIQ